MQPLNPLEVIRLSEVERLQDNRRRVFMDAAICGQARYWDDERELLVVNDPRGGNLGLSLADLREVIAYLEGMGVLEVKKGALRWEYKITSQGMQQFEGDLPWPAGVSPR